MKSAEQHYRNREISWLAFNARVLQEALDKSVPVMERLKFLGIFSSNLDEFFRIRVATLKRMSRLGKKAAKIIGNDPDEVLKQIQTMVMDQQNKFESAYKMILRELATRDIFLINEKKLSPVQSAFVTDYFQTEVRPRLIPIMIDGKNDFPYLKDKSIYLAIRLSKKEVPNKSAMALIEVPSDVLPRFLKLPEPQGRKTVMLLDDVIRFSLHDIFNTFDYDTFEAYTIKLTRDAELDIDNDAFLSYIEKISKSLIKRQKGTPVRFIYDESMPLTMLKHIIRRLHIKSNENIIPGGRYHNFKDFMNFPYMGFPELRYQTLKPLNHPYIPTGKSLFHLLSEHDIMLHYPYQSFHYMIDLLREAAIDPKVESIKMTIYRVAKKSSVINALINAVKNGKKVTVVMELQARFDEENNIYWSRLLEEEGVKVINGVPHYKVHAKLCLIERRESGKLKLYGSVGTGNFNEQTSKVYTDDNLLTADPRITREIEQIFDFFIDNTKIGNYKHLLFAPHFMRTKLEKLIDNETKNARDGKQAFIVIKLNSLVDSKIIDKLYEASQAGVNIKLIIRGICALLPGKKDLSENIEAISIVDKFLEHSRVFLFCNDGKEKMYISSGDWMTRNLANRIEVACPVYDVRIQTEIKTILNIQLNDSTKARSLTEEKLNRYIPAASDKPVRAQDDIYTFLKTGKIGRHIQSKIF